MSSTTSWSALSDPGSASVSPLPIEIEQPDPRRRQLDEAQLVADDVVVVGDEADLVDVERLRAIHVGDRDGDELELPVHGPRVYPRMTCWSAADWSSSAAPRSRQSPAPAQREAARP